MDTALSVATEMVAELDITDQDVTRIADMIDGEIASLVPEWRPGPGIVETPRFSSQGFCHNCVSNHTSSGSLLEFLSHNQGQHLECCKHGCASMHGRFEEITFQSEEYDRHVTEDLKISSQSNHLQYQELWNQHESRELSPVESDLSHSDEQYEQLLDKTVSAEDKGQDVCENKFAPNANSLRNLSGTHDFSAVRSLYCDLEDDYGKEIQTELRWLKAKYQMELREIKDQQLGLTAKSSHSSNREDNADYGIMPLSLAEMLKGGNWNCDLSNHKSSPNFDTQRAQICEAMESIGEGTAKGFHTGSLIPHSLHRTVSLPVDAVDV